MLVTIVSSHLSEYTTQLKTISNLLKIPLQYTRHIVRVRINEHKQTEFNYHSKQASSMYKSVKHDFSHDDVGYRCDYNFSLEFPIDGWL